MLLESAGRAGYRFIEARTLWLQGLIAFDREHFGEARDRWERMLAFAVAARDPGQEAAAHGLLPNLHYTLADAEPAWEHRVASLARLAEAGAPPVRFGLIASAQATRWTSSVRRPLRPSRLPSWSAHANSVARRPCSKH